ncbi:hypothetical protein [Corynebacterium guangdongense]|uniref:PS2 n=1 Tax=Corynebacterium guangdongense TaxID=1783348 RepID=A0ABU2A0X6_9CORY|nr:hypothetical protein [Corynebacterium guangdongense]MDR7330283.1 hypothetical protein [Corynebacterium guangdongense]WJZ18841.1 hypothetical protein CGUA_11525 [Corynebacterium guangdongense]
MFKNRIRTAAIAGIAALATGISGTVVATPAFAQTVQTEATVEANLEASNEQVQDEIAAIAASGTYGDVVTNRDDVFSGDLEVEAADVVALQAEVRASLENARTNVAAAEAAVADAEGKVEAYTAARAAYRDAVIELEDVLYEADRTYTLDGNTFTGQTLSEVVAALYPDVTLELPGRQIGENATYDDALVAFRNLTGQENGVYTDAALETIQDLATTDYADVYTGPAGEVNLEEKAAHEARQAFFQGILNEFVAAEAAVTATVPAFEATREAALDVNVLVRQAEFTEAVSQRNTLQGLDTYLTGFQNYLAAAENPLLTGEWDLNSEEYEGALITVAGAVETAVAAVAAGASVSVIDVTDLVKAELVEQAAANQAAADQAAADAAQRQIDVLLALLAAIEDGKETPAPAPSGNDSSASSVDAELSSGDNAGVFGIVAVIAAILAAIGLALPALNITLPF